MTHTSGEQNLRRYTSVAPEVLRVSQSHDCAYCVDTDTKDGKVSSDCAV